MQLFSKRFRSTAFATLMLCAAAATQAAPVVLDGFSISNFDDGASQPSFSVLSSAGGVTTLTLDTLRTHASVLSGGSVADYFEYAMSMSLSAQAGYKITGYTLSGGLNGTLEVGAVPNEPRYVLGTLGKASNEARLGIQTSNAAPHHDQSFVKPNVNGSQAFDLSDSFRGGSDGLTLSLDAFVVASASYTTYYDMDSAEPWNSQQLSPSLSTLSIRNPVLTVYTAPLSAVPEPGTWAMFSLGLLSLALLKRKQA